MVVWSSFARCCSWQQCGGSVLILSCLAWGCRPWPELEVNVWA